MKKLFYLGIVGLLVFEIVRVYLIMPLPGSQRMDSLPLAYFLHSWRWTFRLAFGLLLVGGGWAAYRAARWGVLTALAIAAGVAYYCNVEMSADTMFHQPRHLVMAESRKNGVPLDKLVIGFADMSELASAYPIQYLGFHHQVVDKVGATPVLVTYCNVCRSGRIFSPIVNGKQEQFRLVGMDHFNALLEDATTGSWWRQATGEAVAGPLKGMQLMELPSTQTTLREWLALHFNSRIMQPDSTYLAEYADMDSYDIGLGRGPFTGTDTLSWQEKSWVVGIQTPNAARAYDWNQLKRERVINDTLGNLPIVLVLDQDNQSFFAFQRPQPVTIFGLRNDTLVSGEQNWQLTGRAIAPTTGNLQKVPAYQEFWHSWRAFHPHTGKY
ncbi:MAG: DUF3179 domain-containing (seleno)protein [Saprospiraceae bacterium]